MMLHQGIAHYVKHNARYADIPLFQPIDQC